MPQQLTREQIIDLLHAIGAEQVIDRGKDEILYSCTIHMEKKPSANVNVTKQVFYCYGCHAAGSLPWLVYRSIPEDVPSIYAADAWIKERYNVDFSVIAQDFNIPSFDETMSLLNRAEKRIVLPRSELAPLRSGKETLKYVIERGLDHDVVERFLIGRQLESQSVSIPVFWENGELAGIVYRAVNPANEYARYRYSPKFPKSKILFPLDKITREAEDVILVEGIFDALHMHRLGYTNTLAIMGNVMSETQAAYIKRRFKRVYDLFDNDSGGQYARNTAIEHLRGMPYYVTKYPEDAKDPCDCDIYDLRKMLGSAELYTVKMLRSCVIA